MSAIKGEISSKALLFQTTDSLETVLASPNYFADAWSYCQRLDLIELTIWHGVDIHSPIAPEDQPQVSATLATFRVMGKRAKLGVGKQVGVELISQYEVQSRDAFWAAKDAASPPLPVPSLSATRVRSRSASAA